MRVTQSGLYQQSNADVALATQELSSDELEVASGRRINVPSDDPTGTAAAIADAATVASADSYTQASSAATSQLSVIDSTLTDIVNQLSTAQTAALAGQGTAVSQSQRNAEASQLLAIRNTLVSDLNTQFGGAYVFSGSQSTTAPFTQAVDGTVSAYQGNSTGVSINIDTGRSVQVTFDGGQITQGSDPDSVFTVLTNLATAVQGGDDTGISTGLTALGSAFNRATQAQAQVGSGESEVTTTTPVLNAVTTNATSNESTLVDANMATAATQMAQAQTSYEAALAAEATLNQANLMNYVY